MEIQLTLIFLVMLWRVMQYGEGDKEYLVKIIGYSIILLAETIFFCCQLRKILILCTCE